ncbi:MAG TPA: rhodanese-like domain-containing protein [Bacteroidia bacterium]
MIKQLIIAVAFLVSFPGIGFAQKAGTVKYVNATEFKSLMEKKKGVLIDLRTPDEIKKGKIKDAEEIDFLAPDAESQIDKLDKKKTYYIYCAGGGRSGECAELMIKKGFQNVVNLQKGFSDWKKAGFEVEMK